MYVQLSAMRTSLIYSISSIHVLAADQRGYKRMDMYYYSTDSRSEVERSLDGRGLSASALKLAAYATTDTARPSGQVSVSRPPRPSGSQ